MVKRFLLLGSLAVNLVLIARYIQDDEVSNWSRKAAREAEEVAGIGCSGHGRAFVDGEVVDGKPICECYDCYGGSDCSQIIPDCVADADSGNPLFLEPFWKRHAWSSAVVVSGWHRMSYVYNDGTLMSKRLETMIRRLHSEVGNAVTQGKFIVFGSGSTQLLNAAVHALSYNPTSSSSSPARVVASIPFYPVYQMQTDWFRSEEFVFGGDTSKWKNRSGCLDGEACRLVEFVTSPNNPDGQLKKALLQSPPSKPIHDRAYYWPHFTAIPSPADDDLMIFTISKITGHAGTRFGWAVVKDVKVYENMMNHMILNTVGVSRDTQLRALKLLKVVVEKDGGEDIFEFGYGKMSKRWKELSTVLSPSKRFTTQKISPIYSNYFHTITQPSPAYVWVKCEKQEEYDCAKVFKEAGIVGRNGTLFFAENRYVRLSLIKSDDDFHLLLQKLKILVAQEKLDGPQTI